MNTTIRLVNTTFTSHNYHVSVVFMVRTFKIYCLSNFQVYSMALLTTVTVLYIKSPELIPLITGNLYPLTNISSFSLPLAPGIDQSTFCSYECGFFRFYIKVILYSICLSLSDLFHVT